MALHKIKISILCFATFFLLETCKTERLDSLQTYEANGHSLTFNHDQSYKYRHSIGEGRVLEFSRGAWKQSGNKLFLLNGVSNSEELPISVRESPSNEADLQLVINILPKKIYFEYLSGARDLVNLELVVDKVIYPLKNETNIVRLNMPLDKGYFRAYPKPNAEIKSDILSDTLQSQLIELSQLKNKILSIDVDCAPLNFAQIKMSNDTLTIVNRNEIRWKKAKLRRY